MDVGGVVIPLGGVDAGGVRIVVVVAGGRGTVFRQSPGQVFVGKQ